MVLLVSHAKAKGLWIPLRKAFSFPHVSGWLSIPYFHPSGHLSGSICLHCAPCLLSTSGESNGASKEEAQGGSGNTRAEFHPLVS